MYLRVVSFSSSFIFSLFIYSFIPVLRLSFFNLIFFPIPFHLWPREGSRAPAPLQVVSLCVFMLTLICVRGSPASGVTFAGPQVRCRTLGLPVVKEELGKKSCFLGFSPFYFDFMDFLEFLEDFGIIFENL